MRYMEPEILHQSPLPLPLQHRTGHTPDGTGLLHNQLGNLPCPWQQTVERHDLVDQAHLLGHLRVDLIASIQVIGGALYSHQLLKRQPLTIPRDETELEVWIK